MVACGGGTGSRGWLQVFADVLGTPVHLARTPEVGARGAVLAALRARGDEVDSQPPGPRRSRWSNPMPKRAAGYDDGYQRYLEHLQAARPFWADPGRAPTGAEPSPSPTTGYL